MGATRTGRGRITDRLYSLGRKYQQLVWSEAGGRLGCAKFCCVRRERAWAAFAIGFVAGFVALRNGGRPGGPVASWPRNVAHRGASVVAPENTLEAFRIAAEAGAGGLELDVHMTEDGKVVVIHDDTVDRTTDGSGAVRGMTLEEVRGLDAGHRFSPDGGATHPWRGRGLRVPELG